MFPLVRSRSRSRFFGDASTLNFNFVDGSPFPGQITFTRASGATRINSSGVLETVGNDVARLDFDPATLAARGLLIEEQRTNLALNSENFTAGSWGKLNTTVTANSTAAPDGTVTADSILETTGTAGHFVNIATAITFTTATQSFYVKPNGRTNVALRTIIGANDWVAVVFNLTGNGSVTQTSVGSSSLFSAISGAIANAGNGWYRISVTATQPSRSVFTGIVDMCTTPTPTLRAIDGLEVYTGDVTKGVYVWGAQFEAGAFPTSYIPTTATALTRSADVASVNTLTPWFNAAAGTLYTEVVASGLKTVGSQYHATIGTSGSNEIRNRFVNAFDAAQIHETTAGETFSYLVAANPNTLYKTALAYQANNSQAAINGTASATDASVTLPTGVSAVYVGMDTGSGSQLNGHIRRITYYPRRLADAQLQSLTA